MKTMAEKYPDPETWNSGANHEEAKRLEEEKRQKEVSMSIKEEIENINKQTEKIKETRVDLESALRVVDELETAEREICIKRLQNADEFISKAIDPEISDQIHNTIIDAINLIKRRI